MIFRPADHEYAPYYGKYIRLVPEGDLLTLLQLQQRRTQTMLQLVSPELLRHRYAAEKWSVTEIVGHLADTERIFAYRALRFARADDTPLAGFDHNRYVPAANFDLRTLGDVAAEFAAVRTATLAFFSSLDSVALQRTGKADGNPVSVRALACIIAGHERHHINQLQTLYGVPALPEYDAAVV